MMRWNYWQRLANDPINETNIFDLNGMTVPSSLIFWGQSRNSRDKAIISSAEEIRYEPRPLLFLIISFSYVTKNRGALSSVTDPASLAKGVLLLSNHNRGLQLNLHKPRRNFFKSDRLCARAQNSVPFACWTKSPPYCILNEALRRVPASSGRP